MSTWRQRSRSGSLRHRRGWLRFWPVSSLRRLSGCGDGARAAAGPKSVDRDDDLRRSANWCACWTTRRSSDRRRRQGRPRPSTDHHPDRRQSGRDRTGGQQPAELRREDHVMKSSQLESAQSLTRILRAVADWMWLVALAVAALAVWLAPGRRRIELRAIAIGVLAVGLLLLVVRRAAGGYLVDQLAKDDSVKPAARDAWSILTQTLSDRAWAGSHLVWYCWSESGSSATPVAHSRRAAPHSPPWRTAGRPTASPWASPDRARAPRSSLHPRLGGSRLRLSFSFSPVSRSSEPSSDEKPSRH